MSRRIVREIPPPLELECLSVLWRLGASNVRAVQAELAPLRTLAYTTVMTMLERLARKQLVERRKSGRHFLYSPAIDRDTVRQHAVRQLTVALFDGSSAQLAEFLRTGNGAGTTEGAAPRSVAVPAAAAVRSEEPYAEDEQADTFDAVLL
jgi:predicted transcriptional regulator